MRLKVLIAILCIMTFGILGCIQKAAVVEDPVVEEKAAAQAPAEKEIAQEKSGSRIQIYESPTDVGASPPANHRPRKGKWDSISGPLTLAKYKVVLGADREIRVPGPDGRLKVWIGGPNNQPNFQDDTDLVKGVAMMPAVGRTAKVTPIAPDFDTGSAKDKCISIHPTGVYATFSLKPLNMKISNTYNVGATVDLYDSNNCSGAAIPKETTAIKVRVLVNVTPPIEEIEKIFWDKLLGFWGGVLALFFALLLFLLRQRLKKWFGFERKG